MTKQRAQAKNMKKKSKRVKKRTPVARAPVGNPANVTQNVNKVPKAIKPPGISLPHQSIKLKEAVCSITNPFCPEAYGAKIPDGNGARTVTAAGRGTFNLTTGATGGFAVGILGVGNLSYSTHSPTTMPLTTATGQEINYSGLTGGSIFATYGDRYRVVSCGFTVRCTQSANNAQGWFLLQTQQSFAYGGAVNNDFIALDNATLANYPGAEFSYVFKPLNKFTSRQFSVNQASGTDLESMGWPTATIIYQGGATGAAIVASVEYFCNIEFLLATHSGLAVLAPPPVKAQPAVIKAAENSQIATPTTIKGGTDVVTSVLTKAADLAWREMQSTSLEELMGFMSFL